jgi:hypothetical protein
VSKNHDQDIKTFFQSFCRDTWIDELAMHVGRACPNLTGVVVYRTRPNETHARIYGWRQINGIQANPELEMGSENSVT